MKNYIFYILFLIFFSCKSQNKENVSSKDFHSSYFQMSLKSEFKNKNSNLIFWDENYGMTIIQDKKVHNLYSCEPKFFFQFGSNNRSTIYIFRNSDSLNLEEVNYVLIPNNMNLKREIELNFYKEYNHKINKFTNEPFLVIRSLWQKEYLLNPNLRDLHFNKEFNENINFLKTYVASYQLDSIFFREWFEYFKYKKYEKYVFTPLKRDVLNQIDKQYLNNIVKLKDSLINDDLFYLRPYQNTLINLASSIANITSKDTPTLFDRLKVADIYFNGKSKFFIKKILLEDVDQQLSANDLLRKNKIIDEFVKECPFTEYTKGLISNRNFKNESLNGNGITELKFISTKNENLNFDNIIVKDYVNYVDCWASWCAPCIKEFPNSENLEKEYKNSRLKFIYISIDENFDKWMKATKNYLKTDNSYIEIKANNYFSKKFNISEIPRYMIFDKNGVLLNSNAPRPSDPKLKEILNEILAQ